MKRLFNEVAAPASGKTVEALEYSRQERDRIKELFKGDLPLSVMKASKGRPAGADDLARGSYEASGQITDMTQPLARAFSASGRGGASGALSQFPQNICEAAVLLYSKPRDTVLDPFAGHNSRMECCARLGRNYVGFDVSKTFMKFNIKRASEINTESDDPVSFIELHEADSRHLDDIYKGRADFCITSPPYYDIEYYGDEVEQLGNAENYATFLARIKEVARALYRRLKLGAFVAWFVNDFRRHGHFIPYHADSLECLRSSGFTPWDILIVNFGWTMRAGFATEIVEQKILPKIHEYGLIVRKML